MNEYEVLGRLYDRLNGDIDYTQMGDYVHALVQEFSPGANLLLDLACGTGKLSCELLSRGYDLIGLDHSPVMLQQAMERAQPYRDRALFICQDMLDFELYGTVDAVVSTLDVINHVTNKNDLARLFRLVYHYLNFGGVFVFDVNTEYKLTHIIGENIFTDDTHDIFYIWENNCRRGSHTTDFHFTFFVQEETGLYRKYEESFSERAYSVQELRLLLTRCGFTLCGVFDAFTRRPPHKASQRLFFIAKKVDNGKTLWYNQRGCAEEAE